MTHTLKIFIPLAVVFAVLVATNFLYAAWTAPSGTPSAANNATAPINVGGTAQDKVGSLGVGGLSVFGRQTIESTSPQIEFSDSNNNDWWIHVNSNRMYFLNDRNDDNGWSGENPWPLVLTAAGPTPASDYALFSNQVRATEYCDRSGGNCLIPDGSSITTYSCPVVVDANCGSSCVGQLTKNSSCVSYQYSSNNAGEYNCRASTYSCTLQ